MTEEIKPTHDVPVIIDKIPTEEELNHMDLSRLTKLNTDLSSKGLTIWEGCSINACQAGKWDGKVLSGGLCPICGNTSTVLFIDRK